MYSPERLVVNITPKASEAMHEIMESRDFKTKTEAVVWALKYANVVRSLTDDGVLLVEKDGKIERLRIL